MWEGKDRWVDGLSGAGLGGCMRFVYGRRDERCGERWVDVPKSDR